MVEKQENTTGISIFYFDKDNRPTAQQIGETTKLYADVFAGHPWYEVNTCADCGKHFGSDSSIETPCSNCGGVLAPAYPEEQTRKQIEDFFDKPNATMYLAESEGKIKGFAWGFLRETSELVSTKFAGENSTQFSLAIREAIPQERMFYINEVGVNKDLRGRGLGKLLVDNLLTIANQLDVPAALTTRIDTVLTPICLKTGFKQTFGQEVVIGQNGKVVVTGRTLVGLKDEPERTFFVRSNL